METQTCGPPRCAPGRRASSPSCASARGRLASITTSARRTSACRSRTPSRSCRSRATDRLRPFRRSKNAAGRGAPRRAAVSTRPSPPWRRHRPAGRHRAGPPTGRTGRRRAARRRLAGRRIAEGYRRRRRSGPRPRRAGPRAARAARRARARTSGITVAQARRDGGPHGRDRTGAPRRARATPARPPCPRHAAATRPSTRRAPRSRRQLPPQLVAPRRHNPMSAARSPSSASASRPGKRRASRSTPSTRPLGRPERLVGQPGQRHGAAGRPALPPRESSMPAG